MKLIATATFAMTMAGLFAAGCAAPKPMTNEEAMTPAVDQPIPVPPGAKLIAFGHYPLPFVAPHVGGMIYVYDADLARVVFVTGYPPDAEMPKSWDLNTLSKSSFDPSHSYRVYYFPVHEPPASQPSATTSN